MTNSEIMDAWTAGHSGSFSKTYTGEWISKNFTSYDKIYSDIREKFSAFPTEISWDDIRNEVRASFSMAHSPDIIIVTLDTSGRVTALELVQRECDRTHETDFQTWYFKNGHSLKPKTPVIPKPERVIFSGPATIAFWPDGTKTVVKCDPDDEYDPGKGLAMCIAKYFYGTSDSKGNYYNVFHEFLDNENNFKKETEQ